MPDICMCDSKKCPLSKACYRHKDSGTVPNEFQQAYFVLGGEGSPSEDADCEHFWLRTRIAAAAHDGSLP